MSGIRPPRWFWVACGILLLWAIAGVFAFYTHISLNAAALAQMTAYDRHFYETTPGWFRYAFAVATLPALAGAVALLMRSRVARPLYVLSLIGVIVQFGWVLGATDLITVKGWGAAAFPAFITAMAIVQLWFCGVAGRRRWLR